MENTTHLTQCTCCNRPMPPTGTDPSLIPDYTKLNALPPDERKKELRRLQHLRRISKPGERERQREQVYARREEKAEEYKEMGKRSYARRMLKQAILANNPDDIKYYTERDNELTARINELRLENKSTDTPIVTV